MKGSICFWQCVLNPKTFEIDDLLHFIHDSGVYFGGKMTSILEEDFHLKITSIGEKNIYLETTLTLIEENGNYLP